MSLRFKLSAAVLGLLLSGSMVLITGSLRASTGTTAPTPPATIPTAPSPLVRPKLAYLAGGSTWNLSTEQFLVFLADVPKALLVLCPAKHLSTDDEFYYYLDQRFELEWAFARKPENDFFKKRGVWSRKVGETTWQLRSSEATLATPS